MCYVVSGTEFISSLLGLKLHGVVCVKVPPIIIIATVCTS